MKKIINNQSGRSMVEMLGVLAIIGVLSIGGIAGYSLAMQKYRTNQAIEAIQLLMTEIRTMFSGQGNYTGLGDADGDIMTSVGIANPFGGLVAAETGTNDSQFNITLSDIPESSCISLATAPWGDNPPSIDGGTALESGDAAADTIAGATKACVLGTGKTQINMTWTFD